MAISYSIEEPSSERAIEELAAEEPSSSEDAQEKRDVVESSIWREVRQVRSRLRSCDGSSGSEWSEWRVGSIGGMCVLVPRSEGLKAVEVVAPWRL
jgi:hypothetical protein